MTEDRLSSLIEELKKTKSAEEMSKACQKLVDYLYTDQQAVFRQTGGSRLRLCARYGPFSRWPSLLNV